MSAVREYTTNLGLGLLNFNFPNWGDDANKNISIIDTAFAVFGFTIRGNWLNSTAYLVGELVADVDEGRLYRVLLNHTSEPTGTFASDRVNTPLRWEPVDTTVSAVGPWQQATVYSTNQFLIDGARYGVTTTNFTSGLTYDSDVTGGKIITLIDLTSYGTLAGFNDPPTAGLIITGNGTAWVAAAPNVVQPSVPSGSRTVWNQTAAPTFWTKDTTHNNKAMRLVNGTVGSGGTVVFTSVFASKAVVGTNQSISLTTAQVPVHSHTVSITSGFVSADHSHSVNINSGTVSVDHNHNMGRNVDAVSVASPHAGAGNTTVWLATTTTVLTGGINANHTHNVAGGTGGISANHSHLVSGNTGNTGSGSTHTHIFTGTPIDLDVQYVDFIIAVKD